jgi:hypothetical protein
MGRSRESWPDDADPGVKLNCPLCGAALTYVQTEGETHVYHCLRHGPIILRSDGWVGKQPN